MRLIFLGTPEFAVPTLERIIAAGHTVSTGVTQPDRPKGRKQELLPSPVKSTALRHGIPVYLYEDSASSEARRNLADIRKGEFEGFAEKMKDSKWSPDFGPSLPHPTAGVVAIGARPPLIAYNINLGTKDLRVADSIARAIRHIGGGFRFVKAMGVELAERGQVQVSINMTNFKKTPLHRVFECVRSEAARYGVSIVGSEIVGLTPAEALFLAAEHYLRLEGFSSDQVLEMRLLEESD